MVQCVNQIHYGCFIYWKFKMTYLIYRESPNLRKLSITSRNAFILDHDTMTDVIRRYIDSLSRYPNVMVYILEL